MTYTEIKKMGVNTGQILVVPILFGEPAQLELIAKATSDTVFDSINQSLPSVFEQIRRFQ